MNRNQRREMCRQIRSMTDSELLAFLDEHATAAYKIGIEHTRKAMHKSLGIGPKRMKRVNDALDGVVEADKLKQINEQDDIKPALPTIA